LVEGGHLEGDDVGSEIGEVLEQHMRAIGMIEAEEMSEHQRRELAAKRAEFEARSGDAADPESGYPASAQLCPKCMTKAMILLDNCMTCLHCGESKCG